MSDFSIDILPGEVMCLLGNNGSGKTSIINMITGLLPLEPGSDVWLRAADDNVVSLRKNLREFRSYVRLCQQNDFLYEELTVKEHLELVSMLRGFHSESVPQVAKDQAEQVGLTAELNK